MSIRATHWVNDEGLRGQHVRKIERMNQTPIAPGQSLSLNTTTSDKTQSP